MFHDAPDDASWANQSEGSLYHSTVGQQPSLQSGSSLRQSEAAFSQLGSVYMVSEPRRPFGPPKIFLIVHVCDSRWLPGL